MDIIPTRIKLLNICQDPTFVGPNLRHITFKTSIKPFVKFRNNFFLNSFIDSNRKIYKQLIQNLIGKHLSKSIDFQL